MERWGLIIEHEDIVAISQIEDEIIAAMGVIMPTEQERLHDLFEQYKDDLDGGKFNALVTFSEECYEELKDKGITSGLLHCFLSAAYHEGYERCARWKSFLKTKSQN